MNIIDKAIEAFNPVAALKRQQARMGMELIRTFQNSGYDESGASRTKIQCAAGRQDQKVHKKTLTRIFQRYDSDQEACICRRRWPLRQSRQTERMWSAKD